MSTRVGGSDYQSTLGLPLGAMQPLITELTERSDTPKPVNQDVVQRLLDVAVEIKAKMATLSVAASRLADLQVGDVIMLDQSPDTLLALQCGTIDIGQARIVNVRNRIGLRIESGPDAEPGGAVVSRVQIEGGDVQEQEVQIGA